MKSFFKYFAASLLSIVVSIPLLFIVVVVSITALVLSGTKSAVTVDEGSVLKITLNEPLVEDCSKGGIAAIDYTNFKIKKTISMVKYLSLIEAAAEDSKIAGIYIEPSIFSTYQLAQLWEIREALAKFKESGKFIYAFAESYTHSTYFLASVADEVYIPQTGDLEWKGLAAHSVFFKNSLDRLGVVPQMIRHGKYKSAIEPFTETKMSDASREQTFEMINSFWQTVVDSVSVSRDIESKLLNNYASNLVISSAHKAQSLGLIDQLKYFDEVKTRIENNVKRDGGEFSGFVSISDYSEVMHTVTNSENKIALISADGEMMPGISGEGYINCAALQKQLSKAREDDDVKAVVLRINSPGGSALSADLIWREVSLLQKKKPVIVSIGSVAASGGYYIAAPADYILAQPTSITGSIGVFGMLFDISKGLNDKLGVTTDVVTTNRYSDLGSFVRPMSAPEQKFMQNSVEQIYKGFVGKVARGRNLSVEEVEKIAGGRVWSGIDALENGLIDGYGTINTAILLAAKQGAVLDDFSIEIMGEDEDIFSQIFSSFANASISMLTDTPSSEASLFLDSYKRIKAISGRENIQALMPTKLEIR